jgi:hypothetical protein
MGVVRLGRIGQTRRLAIGNQALVAVLRVRQVCAGYGIRDP